jgi:16S rRNA (guanine527-N7)-methyltransferase
MNPRDHLYGFLQQQRPDDADALMSRFEAYHQWLVEQNRTINLISRQTDAQDIWTLHLLDSLLALPFIDTLDHQLLDFGTGGGLPGIPLKLLLPSVQMSFLDSRAKKIEAVRSAVHTLGLEGCAFMSARLEELPPSSAEQFDCIVCRSVRIEPRFGRALLRLLVPGGRLLLYKSRNLDDVEQFDHPLIHDVSHEAIGQRCIVEVVKQLGRG